MTPPVIVPAAAATSVTSDDNGVRKPWTWADGPRMSDLERQQYEFEGGGAASERRVGKRRSWLARLFR